MNPRKIKRLVPLNIHVKEFEADNSFYPLSKAKKTSKHSNNTIFLLLVKCKKKGAADTLFVEILS